MPKNVVGGRFGILEMLSFEENQEAFLKICVLFTKNKSIRIRILSELAQAYEENKSRFINRAFYN